MVPVLGSEDVVGAPKYGLWKSYIYKKKYITIWIISQAYLKKFYTVIHFTGSWFLTTSLKLKQYYLIPQTAHSLNQYFWFLTDELSKAVMTIEFDNHLIYS
jgi:hypothetical protein